MSADGQLREPNKAKNVACVKYWKLLADKLSRPVGVGAASQPWIAKGERSSWLTHIEATESVSLCTPKKS
jgi:hypothetical protein